MEHLEIYKDYNITIIAYASFFEYLSKFVVVRTAAGRKYIKKIHKNLFE